ncbi:MAG: YidC/Oxa1 family membrane protein insertase [Ruminococcaceae bacterium]|nr:YidC/Oxa1 family membrane protein insertase [Oscillospiraceae bacterium]
MKLSLFELCITRPLGFIISLIYDIVQNYGLAIILFTIIVKLILLPLQIKSQKAMKKQQKIQPIIAELQKKYANDQQRLQTEMMKVYKENNVSMTGGCLPLLIQMPILFGLYRVIQSPLTYIKGINFTDSAVLESAKQVVAEMVEKFPDTIGNVANMAIEQIVKNYQIQLTTWSELLGKTAELGWDINFNFLGINLSKIPSASLTPILSGNFSDMSTVLLILIPALAIFTTWLSMKQTQGQAQQQSNSGAENTAQSMSKSMTMMMPIMTGFFTFTLPSGIGIYWIISSITQMLQYYFLNKYFETREDDFVVTVPTKNRKNSKKRR